MSGPCRKDRRSRRLSGGGRRCRPPTPRTGVIGEPARTGGAVFCEAEPAAAVRRDAGGGSRAAAKPDFRPAAATFTSFFAPMQKSDALEARPALRRNRKLERQGGGTGEGAPASSPGGQVPSRVERLCVPSAISGLQKDRSRSFWAEYPKLLFSAHCRAQQAAAWPVTPRRPQTGAMPGLLQPAAAALPSGSRCRVRW